MPWFVVDDSAHSHPKLVKAGNAAVGLWMRCGSYAAQHLTDGVVPGAIASMYGTLPQATKLVRLGLWHPAGHTCGGCAHPPTGDYVMHDYLLYNPTRRQVRDRREKAAEKKRRQRGQVEADGQGPEMIREGFEDDSSANRERIEDENDPIHRPLFHEHAGQGDASPGDSFGTRARAFPSPPLPYTDKGADEGGRGTGSRGPDHASGAPIDDDGFALTDAMRRWAVSTFGNALDIDYETAQFISHHRGEATRRRSWPDEWQKWLRRSAKFASERAQRQTATARGGNVVALPTGLHPTGTDRRVADHYELIAQMEAEEQTS